MSCRGSRRHLSLPCRAGRDGPGGQFPQGLAQGGTYGLGGRSRRPAGALLPYGGGRLLSGSAPLHGVGSRRRGWYGRCGGGGRRGRGNRRQPGDLPQPHRRAPGDGQGRRGPPRTYSGGPRTLHRSRSRSRRRSRRSRRSRRGRRRSRCRRHSRRRRHSRLRRRRFRRSRSPFRRRCTLHVRRGRSARNRAGRPCLSHCRRTPPRLPATRAPRRSRPGRAGHPSRPGRRLVLSTLRPGRPQQQRPPGGSGTCDARAGDTVDEAHRGGRQYGVAEFAAEGGVLPGGELGPEPQPVAHPDRGPGDGHRGRCDLTPAPVPARTGTGTGTGAGAGTGSPRTRPLRTATNPGTRTHARTTISTGTRAHTSPGLRARARPWAVRSAQPVPEPHTITRLR
ncbi:hypothetical protein GA0115243_10629 [Streptomyces sp. ScaeMP-e83]|nr:hypothetical protein GA0115243_10629 [Streptomyces sp. ScaeMP-e83]